MLLELRDLCESWYCMLVTRLLYHNPTVKSTDVQYHTQFCIDAYGGNHCLQPWDNVLLAALEFDIHQVIKEARYYKLLYLFIQSVFYNFN